MKRKIIVSLSAAALAVAGCGHKNADPAEDRNAAAARDNNLNQTMPEAAAPALSSGQAFANAAAASDSFEIESSRLAIANSQSAAIRSFAQQMIEAHTGSTIKLKAAAAAAAPVITPDPALTADQQAKLDALKGANGADFDKAYAAAQTSGHEKALDALKSYAATGEVPTLKSFARGIIPTVTAHLNMAKGLRP
jgi:putative membrane protein